MNKGEKMKPTILIGAGKGKLLPVLQKALESMGHKMPDIGRKLVFEIETKKYNLKIALLRWRDLQKQHSKFDMITYGTDQWLEEGHKSMVALKFFPHSKCRISLLVPDHMKNMSTNMILRNYNVASRYPILAKEYLGVNDNQIIPLSGSVEAAVGMGWAETIFDVVESGRTARENNLYEKKEYIHLGAILATSRPEKIPLFENLGLIDPQRKGRIIGFDGIDGSGKSTLARHLVQCGLWQEHPVVLVTPFSGQVGREADSLRLSQKYAEWASVIGKHHWHGPKELAKIYDRSVLTWITEMIGEDEEKIMEIAQTWKPFPDMLFHCRINNGGSYQRQKSRGTDDEFAMVSTIREYNSRYEKAVQFAKDKLGINVIELSTDNEVEETLKQVKKYMEE